MLSSAGRTSGGRFLICSMNGAVPQIPLLCSMCEALINQGLRHRKQEALLQIARWLLKDISSNRQDLIKGKSFCSAR